MNILLLVGQLNLVGGIEKYNNDVINSLEESHDITIVERAKGGLSKKISFTIKIFFLVIFHRFDLIYCSHINFSAICLLIKLILKIPFTITLYGIDIYNLSLLQKISIKKSTALIVLSEYFKHKLLKKIECISDKIFILPSMVDERVFHPNEIIDITLYDKFKIPKNKSPIILTLARLSQSEHKGQDRVVRAMVNVVNKYPNAIYIIASIKTIPNPSNLEGITKTSAQLYKKHLCSFSTLPIRITLFLMLGF